MVSVDFGHSFDRICRLRGELIDLARYETFIPFVQLLLVVRRVSFFALLLLVLLIT